jgi:hypothetical protein
MRLTKVEKEARAKRLKEYQGWLKKFKAYWQGKRTGISFSYIDNAPALLNDLYWRLAEDYIRPLLKNGEGELRHPIHPYKIIAVSEIAVMMTEPISLSEKNKNLEKQVNAMLAWFIATQIIENWDTGSKVKVTASEIYTVAGFLENIKPGEKYDNSFEEEHIQWLEILNVSVEKPFLLLAQSWRLFYIACLGQASKGKLK